MTSINNLKVNILLSHPNLTDNAINEYVNNLDPNDPKREHITSTLENLNSDYPEHREIAAINLRILILGEHWAKCLNCGDAFSVEDAGNDSVCSPRCSNAYSNYLMG